MPPIITSITLKVVNQSVCYSGATYSNMLVPATDGVECMGNTEIQAGTLIFLLGGPKDVWIRAPEPPWLTQISESRKTRQSSLSDDLRCSSAARDRLKTWAIVQLAKNGVRDDILFRRGTGECIPLIPTPLSMKYHHLSHTPVPLQKINYNLFAIPPALANRRCNDMNEAGLLTELNRILKPRSMQSQTFRCMTYLLQTCYDLGSAYGMVRPYWETSLHSLPEILARQKAVDAEMRRGAVEDGYLKHANIPPRRVWDLYSNRVLPYYILPLPPESNVSDRLWPVSHSWQDPSNSKLVGTHINCGAWPVPIPRTTTLHHVRVELLNLGAEYVWLDVLCLRQIGRKEDEPARIHEWKLDIPTIGYIYATRGVPCITYFNGLGLPFDPSSAARQSTRHWLQRVWTVQETTHDWLPGGLTTSLDANAAGFFDEYHARAIVRRTLNSNHCSEGELHDIARILKERCSEKALDKVSSIPYILGCATRPLYESTMSPDLAWAVLLKHLSAAQRGSISLRHIDRHRQQSTILPTWQEFLEDFSTTKQSDYDLTRSVPLQLADWSPIGAPEPGEYWDRDECAGPFVITSHTIHPTDVSVIMTHQNNGDQGTSRGDPNEKYQLSVVVSSPFDCKATYFLRRLRGDALSIFQILGERTMEQERAFWVQRCGIAYLQNDTIIDGEVVFQGAMPVVFVHTNGQ